MTLVRYTIPITGRLNIFHFTGKIYQLIFRNRGYFLIFNFANFDQNSKYYELPREGSHVDVRRLKRCFTALGFEVKTYDDLKKRKVVEKLKKYEKFDMTKCDMFGMAILTHGEENGKLFTRDEEMNLNEFIHPIKMNPTLVQKPKVNIDQKYAQK